VWSLLAAAAAAAAIAGCGSEAERAGFEVLVFSRTTAYRHAEAIEASRAALEAMGAERGFAVESTERLPDLDGVEVVVLLQTNGEGVIQRQLGHGNLGFPASTSNASIAARSSRPCMPDARR